MDLAFFFFIVGTTGRERPVEGGVTVTRACPNCDATQHLDEYKTVYYFTLFFLPLFPVREGDHYLKCRGCETTYALTEAHRRDSHAPDPNEVAQASFTAADPSDDADLVEMNCIQCPGKLLVPDTGKLLRVTCPHCRTRFEVRTLGSAAEVKEG